MVIFVITNNETDNEGKNQSKMWFMLRKQRVSKKLKQNYCTNHFYLVLMKNYYLEEKS